jgi:hypothetical protein
MRSNLRRPIITTLTLVGAMSLFAGCGDPGAHLPAGMTGSSAAYTSSQSGVVDSVLGGDPGPATTGVSSMVDDPVLSGYDDAAMLDGIETSDVFQQAASDWNDNEGSVTTMSSNLDDLGLDDDPMPVGYDSGYGYGGGYGNDFGAGSYGYGGAGLQSASFGADAYGGIGAMDAGIMDAGFDDGGIMDAGFDPGFDAGFDPGLDVGGFDAGFDPGMDVGGFDPGFADAGFDPGLDVGGFDAGFDPGMDVGGFDAGGFDAGFGF